MFLGFSRVIPRLLVRSIADHDDWSYDRSSGATIDIRSVAEFHYCSYDRSSGATIDIRRSHNSPIDRTIDRLWLPLVVRFPTMDHAIDLLQSLLDARPRVRAIVRWPTTSQKTDRSIVANIADRLHVHQIAINRTIWCDCTFTGRDSCCPMVLVIILTFYRIRSVRQNYF